MKLTFELVDRVKQIALPNVDEPHPIHWRSGWSNNNKKTWTRIHSINSLGNQVFGFELKLTSVILVLRLLMSDWNYTISSPESLACQLQIMDLVSKKQ